MRIQAKRHGSSGKKNTVKRQPFTMQEPLRSQTMTIICEVALQEVTGDQWKTGLVSQPEPRKARAATAHGVVPVRSGGSGR